MQGKSLYIRIDAKGRAVAGSTQWRKSPPKNGRWKKITGEYCPCTTTTTTTTTSSTTTTTTT